MIHAITDTHGLIWYLSEDTSLSKQAADQFDYALENDRIIGVSAISVVEIVYLVEKGRIVSKTLTRLEDELSKGFPILEIIPASKTTVRICA